MSQSIPLMMRVMASSITAANRAGKIIRDVMSQGELGIVEKGKDDLQTEADRSAQRCIIASLSKQFPNITIIGEEGVTDVEVPSDWLITQGDQDTLKKICPDLLKNVAEEDIVIWVDPLDGTSEYTQGALLLKGSRWERWKYYLRHPFVSAHGYLSFLHAKYGFLEHVTVLIGISVKEKPIGGVIHQPYYGSTPETNKGSSRGRTIWGLQGYGVEGLVPPPSVGIPRQLVITTSRSHSNALVESCLEALKPDNVLRVGGAGYKVLQLLEGKANAYVFASGGCKKWDTCAPEAILRAAGGKLTDMFGKDYEYGKNVIRPNKRGVLATLSSELHSLLLGKIPEDVKTKLNV